RPTGGIAESYSTIASTARSFAWSYNCNEPCESRWIRARSSIHECGPAASVRAVAYRRSAVGPFGVNTVRRLVARPGRQRANEFGAVPVRLKSRQQVPEVSLRRLKI